MILIKEDKPNKMTGSTSLFLSFDFNKDVIETIKKEPIFDFNSQTKLWEVPLTSLLKTESG